MKGIVMYVVWKKMAVYENKSTAWHFFLKKNSLLGTTNDSRKVAHNCIKMVENMFSKLKNKCHMPVVNGNKLHANR